MAVQLELITTPFFMPPHPFLVFPPLLVLLPLALHYSVALHPSVDVKFYAKLCQAGAPTWAHLFVDAAVIVWNTIGVGLLGHAFSKIKLSLIMVNTMHRTGKSIPYWVPEDDNKGFMDKLQQLINDVISWFRDHAFRAAQSLSVSNYTTKRLGLIVDPQDERYEVYQNDLSSWLSWEAQWKDCISPSLLYFGPPFFHTTTTELDPLTGINVQKDSNGTNTIPYWSEISHADIFTAATVCGWLITALRVDFLKEYSATKDQAVHALAEISKIVKLFNMTMSSNNTEAQMMSSSVDIFTAPLWVLSATQPCVPAYWNELRHGAAVCNVMKAPRSGFREKDQEPSAKQVTPGVKLFK
ncbi:hypothetical protein BDN67DRAFT_985601 [Paxillus ammoniavirescens]|nr:hypothetical protein BDN67DRAFT_985601 [Paxillus ammoniavirescens]